MPPRPSPQPRIARQPIWEPVGGLHGHEFLYRTPDGAPAHVDLWSPARQDGATASVLEALYGVDGPRTLARAFVNVTRAFLVAERALPYHHDRLVLEVVETVPADTEVLDGLARLRDLGYRIAIDDFTAAPQQVAMIPFADYVKIDCRDLAMHGTALIDLARTGDALVVAERVSTAALVDSCRTWGFDLLQGDVLGAATTAAR